jgi:hypothetical protein
MTRILLRPHELPRYPRNSELLHGDWHWWKMRLPVGDQPVHAADRPDDIEEASVTFNRSRDPDTTLLNPPAFRMITTRRVTEFPDLQRRFVDSERIDCYVVWWGCPGLDWYALPGNTCHPGDYQISDRTEIQGCPDPRRLLSERTRDAELHEIRFHSGQPLLSWPHTIDFTEAVPLNREQIAAAFGIPAELLATMLSPNTVRRLEGLTPLYEGPVTVSRQPQMPRYTVDDTLTAFQRYADPARLREFPPGSRYNRRRDPRRAPKTGNDEQEVLDAIDELVNEQLDSGPRDDYARDYVERCPVCGEGWHGLTGTGGMDQFGHSLGAAGCPGAFADEEEIKQWRG